MDKILKFLEFSSIDPRLYWRISDRKGEAIYEIQWRREERIHWRLRRIGALLWDLSTEDNLINDLEARDIDVYLFEMKLKNTLLQQVSFASRIVDDAKNLFGPSDVEHAIAEQTSFLQQLEAALVKLTTPAKPSKPQLRILKA